MMRISKKQILKYLPVSVVVITAFFSTGFLHPDEHYQILELLNLKLGRWSDPNLLTWDYHERIRPWFQILVYYGLAKITFVDDPFVLSFIFRLFNGLLGFLAIKRILPYFLEENQIGKLYHSLLIIFFTWFIPFLLVRNNSESLSTSLFLLGASFYVGEKKNSIWSGLLFGLSFCVRYQMGVVILFVNILSLFKDRKYKFFVSHSFFVLVGIAIGIYADYWGYGELSFSALNYFRENIIHSKASNFGVSPFYFYFTESFIKGGVLVPLVLWIGIANYHLKKRLDFWTVAFWSFLIIHSLIPHKELRFIHFNYVLSALMAASFMTKKFAVERKSWALGYLIVSVLFMLRTSFLSLNSYIGLYKYIHSTDETSVYVYEEGGKGVFQFTMPFYQRGRVESLKVSFDEIAGKSLVLTTKYSTYKKVKQEVKECEIKFRSYPDFIEQLNFSNWLARSSMFTIWQCD